MVSERGLSVLRAIVEDYVTTQEPVGSKLVATRHGFNVSAATIRNEMAKLEDEGFIVAPHTSAGRIPTEKGYRQFVDALHEVRAINAAQKRAIEAVLNTTDDIDQLLLRATSVLSQLTNHLAVLQYPDLGGNKLRHLDLVQLDNGRVLIILIGDHGEVQQRSVEFDGEYSPEEIDRIRDELSKHLIGEPLHAVATVREQVLAAFPEHVQADVAKVIATLDANAREHRRDRLYVAGTARLLRASGELHDSALPVLEAIEEQVMVLQLLQTMHEEDVLQGHSISVRIGSENQTGPFQDASIVAGDYLPSESESARVGVIGPTRMHYSRNMMAVRAISKYLSDILGR